MGLPQELVDYIIDMLRDDLRALSACSLTCKSMLTSARRLIHYTLRLTFPNNEGILTQEEKSRDPRWDRTHLRLLSYMGERGLLQHTRRVDIDVRSWEFTPKSLLPHLGHFQSLDNVHTLVIKHYDARAWDPPGHYRPFFAHFYPTLTSLTLNSPHEPYWLVVKFILQFPHLENLCLERPTDRWRHGPGRTVPHIVHQSPPLCGLLRLDGCWPVDFGRALPNGINFRSVELKRFSEKGAQKVLNTCADTLDNLTFDLQSVCMD